MIEAATINADGSIGTVPIGVRAPNPALAAARVLRALEPGNRPLLNSALFNLACQLAGQEVGGLPFGRLPGNLGTVGLDRADAIRAELQAMTDDELRVTCTGLGAVKYIAPPSIAVHPDDEPDADFESSDVEACTVGRMVAFA